MNLSADEDVLERYSPKRILLQQLQLQLRQLPREGVEDRARSQVRDALAMVKNNLLNAYLSAL
jgi:ABC-type Fe2+-enterobactin transport system substrate-binding protein